MRLYCTLLEFQLQNVRFLQIYCDFFPCNGFCGGVLSKGNEPICKKRRKKNLLTEGSAIKRLVRKEKHAQLLSVKRGCCCRSFIREPQCNTLTIFLPLRFYVKSILMNPDHRNYRKASKLNLLFFREINFGLQNSSS